MNTVNDESAEEKIKQTEQTEQKKTFFTRQRVMILAPLAVILIIVIACTVRIIMWFHPPKYRYKEREVDPESKDFYAVMDASVLAGRDDGETHILILGDGLLSAGEYDIPSKIASETDATVYNCEFPGSSITSRNDPFDAAYSTDVFSFVLLAHCINTGDYTIVNNYKKGADIYAPSFEKTLTRLKEIDFNKIDIVLLSYGTYDYLNGYPLSEEQSLFSKTAMTNALYTGIYVISQAYPHIRFAVVSPTFCYYTEDDGKLTAGDLRRADGSNENLGEYLFTLAEICRLNEITFLDNYFGCVLNSLTAEDYMLDALHVNEEIQAVISDKIIDFVLYKQFQQ